MIILYLYWRNYPVYARVFLKGHGCYDHTKCESLLRVSKICWLFHQYRQAETNNSLRTIISFKFDNRKSDFQKEMLKWLKHIWQLNSLNRIWFIKFTLILTLIVTNVIFPTNLFKSVILTSICFSYVKI